jgi:tetratricopeptide (TPR) repeat protein
MHDPLIQSLLGDLKSDSEDARNRATQDLWRIWFQQKGAYGLELLGRSQAFMDAGLYDAAEDLLTEIVRDQPDFAEAWNRRAVLYYLKGDYSKAIADCQNVIALNPIHFGALHGLGLCYVALGDYRDAIYAFQRALEIQPYALTNQKLILECTAKLS